MNVDEANNGSLNTCTPALSSSSTPAWIPYGIDFATVDGIQYAYVADNGIGDSTLGNVYRCTLTVGGSSNGLFNTCTATPNPTPIPPTLWTPPGIAFRFN